MSNKLLIFLIGFFLINSILFAQSPFARDFNDSFNHNKNYSFTKIKERSINNNAYDFMALGYFINANNNMYLKTKEKKYLDYNLEVLKPILVDKGFSNYKNNNWKMDAPLSNQNAIVNGQEHLISEGYFFRYVGEFLDIIKTNKLYKKQQKNILNGLKFSFQKWKERSFDKHNDYSLFFHLRLHTGANWATVALYLKKYDSKKKSEYTTFINQFDEQLKKALKLKSKDGLMYYEWNSTYPEKFCNSLKNRKEYKPVIQDVSHGNHVVLYLIKANELNNPNWKNFNYTYLANTLKVNILKPDVITDNVDGTANTQSVLKNSGWKISDGWYKLIYYDNDLISYFKKCLPLYESKIKNSFLELQFNSIYL